MNIRLLSTYRLAGVLCTTHQQASALIRSGALPSVKLPNGEPRVDVDDVRAWVNRSKATTQQASHD